MSRVYVYSFEDTVVTISHPNFGTYSAYGTGIGSISVTYANNVSTQAVAADLAVVISKTAIRNGSVTFDVLQSSDFNKYLKRLTSFLEESDSSQFALTTIRLSNKSTGDSYYCTGVSHLKKADNSFQAQAQNRSWEMLCANISQE